MSDILPKIKKFQKSLISIVLVGLLVGITLKDNVHFGAVTLNNSQENHYAWGIAPTITAKGDIKGNLSSYGLFMGANMLRDNSSIKGNAYIKGFLCFGHRKDINLFVNSEENMNYTHRIKKK